MVASPGPLRPLLRAAPLLLLLAALPAQAAIPLVLSGYSMAPAVPMAGDRVVLTVTLKNSDPAASVALDSINFYSLGAISATASGTFTSPGALGPGQTADFTFLLNAAATDGSYGAEVQVTAQSQSFRFPVPFRVDSRPLNLFLNDPPSLVPLEGASFQVTVANPRSNDVTGLRLVPRAPGIRFSPSEVYVGTLASGASSTQTFTAYAVESGSPTLRVAVFFLNGDNAHQSETSADVSVETRSTLVVSISNDTRSISQGSSELVFLAANQGNGTLRDLQLLWSDPSGGIVPVGVPATFFVGRLDPGQTARFPFEVSASRDLAQGVHSLNVTLRYTDPSGIQKTRRLPLGVLVGGATSLEVTPQGSGSGGLSLSVANVGVNPASGVVVRIPAQPGVRGEDSVTLGDLRPGDYALATFRGVSLNGSAAGLQVLVDYTDTTGVRHSVPKEVTAGPAPGSATAAPSGEGGGFPVAPLLGLLAAGGLLYWKRGALRARLGRPPAP